MRREIPVPSENFLSNLADLCRDRSAFVRNPLTKNRYISLQRRHHSPETPTWQGAACGTFEILRAWRHGRAEIDCAQMRALRVSSGFKRKGVEADCLAASPHRGMDAFGMRHFHLFRDYRAQPCNDGFWFG